MNARPLYAFAALLFAACSSSSSSGSDAVDSGTNDTGSSGSDTSIGNDDANDDSGSTTDDAGDDTGSAPSDSGSTTNDAGDDASTDTGGVADAGKDSGAASDSGSDAGSTDAGGGGKRPSYNTGVGFFIGTDNKLYDANGVPFVMRGVNRTHYDDGAATAIAKSGANAERWVLYWGNGTTAAQFATQMTTENHDHGIVAIPGVWDTDSAHGSATLTCSSDTSALTHAVDMWVAQAAAWKTIERWSIIDIANEWGPNDSTTWRDSYIDAVKRMRAAGYGATLMIDSGGCGQDAPDIIKYGAAVFAADPQKNVLFSIHVYGNVQDGQAATFLASLKATGLPIVVGEFGPGRNIGPSPTNLKPGELITAANANGMGWLAWAWDDNDLAGASSDDNWFAMIHNNSSPFTSDSDLTIFGTDVVLNATYGLQKTAVKATVFP